VAILEPRFKMTVGTASSGDTFSCERRPLRAPFALVEDFMHVATIDWMAALSLLLITGRTCQSWRLIRKAPGQ